MKVNPFRMKHLQPIISETGLMALRLRLLSAALIGLLLTTACTLETEQQVIEGTTVHLALLRTSDMHSRMFPYDLVPNSHDQNDGLYVETAPYGGFERIAALIKRERQRGSRVLYLDSGDIYQGAPVFNFGSGEPEFRWQSNIGVDAMVMGNHEFDKGAKNLADQARRWINYPLLAANYLFDDPKANKELGREVEPYTIINTHGLKVGIIGLGDVGSMYSIRRGGNSVGITPIESTETARMYVDFLSPVVDLVVVLSHMGLTDDKELVAGRNIYLKKDKIPDIKHFLQRKPEQDRWQTRDCPECSADTAKYWIPGVRGIDIILGGHLHILTDPPMILRDPAGREVLLEHPGAFAKFLTRIDLSVAVPSREYFCNVNEGICVPQDAHFSNRVACQSHADCAYHKLAPYGAEIVAHRHSLFPIDSMWCGDPRPQPDDYTDGIYDTMFAYDVQSMMEHCRGRGHGPTRNLLEPIQLQLQFDPNFLLTQIFGYAPKSVLRKDTGSGGDSALGNMTTFAMMIRKRVEAEFCVTNTLGIRDNFYPGVIDMETVFNVFPFENTITVMYLSGQEVQELYDFVTERSSGRGCQSQAQIAGSSFVMNCGQVKRNRANYSCSVPQDCCQYRPEICDVDYEGTAAWQCNQGRCYGHPAEEIMISGQPLQLEASYKMATNDYIAKGGSGFEVLRRNTTKVDTGIAMRDALTEYLRSFPSCNQLIHADPNQVDPFALSFCLDYETKLQQGRLVVRGSCTCTDVLAEDFRKCRSLGPAIKQFCRNPLYYPIIVGESDGRIQRKVN